MELDEHKWKKRGGTAREVDRTDLSGQQISHRVAITITVNGVTSEAFSAKAINSR
jgi:hypothetical protein